MAEIYENQEKAQSLFEAGFYKEEKRGLIKSLTEIGEDRAEKAKKFYNEKCTGGTNEKITREEAKEMLREYDLKKTEWRQSSGVETDDSIISSIIGVIFAILLIAVWLCIRYAKLLIANHKNAKLVDAMELRTVSPELEDKCASYREALTDLKTCPKRIKALAGTNTFMPAAGAVYIILALFNFIFYYMQYKCSMIAPLVILFALQLVLGAALLARHKFSAGILFGIQSLFGIFVLSFKFMVPQRVGIQYYSNWDLAFSHGINVNGVIAVALFAVLCLIMMIYFMSNAKNKIFEIIIYAGFIGCSLFAHSNFELAMRITHRNRILDGSVLPVIMLEFAWFVIVLLMLKGKKKINAAK